MKTTTVACVWVKGEYPYSAEYVTRLYAMVARWMDRPFQFVCLTDQPEALAAPILTVPVAKLAGFAPWTKLELFNPVRAWPGRVLYLDLDSLVVSSLGAILDVQAPFAITDDPPSAHRSRRVDAFGRAIVRRFNSSVMVWDGGTQTDLYEAWKPHVVQRLSGDQDWIGERAPSAYAMPRAWFPRFSEISLTGATPDAKVVLCKVPKNHVAAATHPWVADIWGAA